MTSEYQGTQLFTIFPAFTTPLPISSQTEHRTPAYYQAPSQGTTQRVGRQQPLYQGQSACTCVGWTQGVVGSLQSASASSWLLHRPLGLVSIILKVNNDHKSQPSIAPHPAEKFTLEVMAERKIGSITWSNGT